VPAFRPRSSAGSAASTTCPFSEAPERVVDAGPDRTAGRFGMPGTVT
jgi:hypothetical protein